MFSLERLVLSVVTDPRSTLDGLLRARELVVQVVVREKEMRARLAEIGECVCVCVCDYLCCIYCISNIFHSFITHLLTSYLFIYLFMYRFIHLCIYLLIFMCVCVCVFRFGGQ